MATTADYNDGRIRLDDRGVRISWYYLWGAKRIPYARIHSARAFRLDLLHGKWRIWGSSNPTTWFNLDPTRSRKEVGISFDTHRPIRPVITPDRPAEVLAVLRSRQIDVRDELN